MGVDRLRLSQLVLDKYGQEAIANPKTPEEEAKNVRRRGLLIKVTSLDERGSQTPNLTMWVGENDALAMLEDAYDEEKKGRPLGGDELLRELTILRIERAYARPSTASTTEQAQQYAFKMKLVNLYDSPSATQMPKTLKCMVSGLTLPAEEVTAAHIFPKVNHVEAMYNYGVNDIYDERNGLLWCAAIEKAWHQGTVAILVDPTSGDHIFHVLTDSMNLTKLTDMRPMKQPHKGMNKTQAKAFSMTEQQISNTYGSMTFGNLDGSPLQFPSSTAIRPMQRALVYNAALAIALQRQRDELSKNLNIGPHLMKATSDFQGKAKLNEWLEYQMASSPLGNGSD